MPACSWTIPQRRHFLDGEQSQRLYRQGGTARLAVSWRGGAQCTGRSPRSNMLYSDQEAENCRDDLATRLVIEFVSRPEIQNPHLHETVKDAAPTTQQRLHHPP